MKSHDKNMFFWVRSSYGAKAFLNEILWWKEALCMRSNDKQRALLLMRSHVKLVLKSCHNYVGIRLALCWNYVDTYGEWYDKHVSTLCLNYAEMCVDIMSIMFNIMLTSCHHVVELVSTCFWNHVKYMLNCCQ